MNALHDALVSVVMRTLGGRAREIRRALQSVAANTYRPLEVVIVYQGRDEGEWALLQTLPVEFEALSIRIVQNRGDGDRRAENLNIGWRLAQGRYLGFLDDDDSLEREHFALLTDALLRSGRAWAYSQTTLRKEDDNLKLMEESRPFRRHRFSVVDLWTENFIPIHSFLLDRARLVPELQTAPFCEQLDRSEDWDFLIRLGFFHEPETLDAVTCNYYVSLGTRNTNLSLMSVTDPARQEANRAAWARCKALVEDRKLELLRRAWWAREMFQGAVSPPPNAQTVPVSEDLPPPLPAGGLRRRLLRAVIRRLERQL